MAAGAIIGVIGSVVGGALNIGKGAQDSKQQSEQYLYEITQQSIKDKKRNNTIMISVSIVILIATLFVVYLIIKKK